MGAACKVYPTITVNGEERDSELFKDLLHYTKDRDQALMLWAYSKTIKNDNLERDANGEPTLASLKRELKLDEFFTEGDSVRQVKRELNAEDSEGNPIAHKDVLSTIRKVVESNERNPRTVASVRVTSEGAFITVSPRTAENHNVPEEVKFGSELNNRLLGILRRMGFDAAYMENPRFAGMFSPEKAMTTARGLQAVIQIAKGELGEEAFPEEFSHLLIQGLQNNPITKRLLNSLSSIDTVKEVLGAEYEKYVDLYQGDTYKLQMEAAGKLLSQHLKKETPAVDRKGILERLWGVIRDLIKGTRTAMIEDAIYEAHQAAEELSKLTESDEIFEGVDAGAILSSDTFYDTKKHIDGVAGLLESGIETASRRMKLLADRTLGKEYDPERADIVKTLQILQESKKYTLGCVGFLQATMKEAQEMLEKIKAEKEEGFNEKTSLGRLRRSAQILREIKEFVNGYKPIIETFRNIEALRENGEVELSDEDLETLSSTAKEVSDIISRIETTEYKPLRDNVLFAFLKRYWGEDKLIKDANGKETSMTLRMVMDAAAKDINFVDRWISSLSDAADPLLSLIDKVVKDSHNKRDEKIQEILSQVRAINEKFTKSEGKTDFMYDRDDNGKPTGWIISRHNYKKYSDAKRAYVESLKDKKLTYSERKAKVQAWIQANNEPIEPGSKVLVPIRKYDYAPGESPIDKLTPAQKEYYDSMMSLKMAMDSYLPERFTNPYRAVQIRNDATEAILQNVTNPKEAFRVLKGVLADSIIKREDDDEFGADPDKSNVTLDFAGRRVNRLPIYFVNMLEDMNRLSTDFTSSMMAYAGMAVNYDEMNNLVDLLEVTREFVKDREVQETNSGNPQNEVMKVLGKVFKRAYTTPGSLKNIGDRIDDYYDSEIYGRREEDYTIKVLGKDVSVTKGMDSLKNYTGLVGLGLNLFAGISNVVQGKLQMFYEGVAGEYFNMKDLAVSTKNYWRELPGVLAEVNNPNKSNKLTLLIEKYDALEEFYEELKRTDYYKSPVARIIGNTNWYFLNSMGEHYLHTRNMLAMLNNIKVKDKNGNEMSLFDAYEVKTDENGASSLILKEGTTNLDGELLSTEGIDMAAEPDRFQEVRGRLSRLVSDQKLRIGKVNQSMNGAFNASDKGAIHRNVLGRMAMQFRQWMPAHYTRRFGAKYYDAALDQEREGFYRTFATFMGDCMKDMFRAKGSLAAHWAELTPHEKANVSRALSELGVFISLCLVVGLAGNEKDKKNWSTRMAIYQLKRAKLETGAAVPWFSFFSNTFEIMKSPAASINKIDNLIDLFKIHNMFIEIQSGKYKGMSQWEKDFMQALPLYGQIKKGIDLKNENYMFQIVN